MSDDKPVFVQLVELLGVAEAVANEQPVIVITIRPDPPNFWPHNIAIHQRPSLAAGTRPGKPTDPVRSAGERSPGDGDWLRCKSRGGVGQVGLVVGRDGENGG